MLTPEQLNTLTDNGWVVDRLGQAATKDYGFRTDAHLLWTRQTLSASFWTEGRNILSWVWRDPKQPLTDSYLIRTLEMIDDEVLNPFYIHNKKEFEDAQQ